MTKHEQARKQLSEECFNLDFIEEYIKQSEATEKELEIYKKLHQKYQYLNENTNDYDLNVDEAMTIHDEIYELEERLLEQGKK